jgi:hypothetical protein
LLNTDFSSAGDFPGAHFRVTALATASPGVRQ